MVTGKPEFKKSMKVHDVPKENLTRGPFPLMYQVHRFGTIRGV